MEYNVVKKKNLNEMPYIDRVSCCAHIIKMTKVKKKNQDLIKLTFEPI